MKLFCPIAGGGQHEIGLNAARKQSHSSAESNGIMVRRLASVIKFIDRNRLPIRCKNDTRIESWLEISPIRSRDI